ncbi:TRAP transporter substrate-binding protein [Nocardioides sp.]|uniref:TRAP transporter substrate-binding protein n=1 Tax=Nocardioides sp. TaxID=35761 RepID=UPI002620EE24|nr:TRAP transporter substrate-binding protein [Nocardioides sp.]
MTLTLGHPFAPEHLIQTEVLEPWAEEVEEATDGKVKIEIVPGGALGAGDVVYENVNSGAQDLGFSAPSYTPGRFPITDVVELPFLFDSAVEGTETMWQVWEEFPEFQEEYGDTKVLGLWANDIGDLWTSKKPISTLEDVKGLTLRAPGNAQVELVNQLGGSGTVIPGAEVYDSIDRGVIDGLMVADSGLVTLNLLEGLINYGVICNCYTNTGFLVANQDAWDALTEDQQEAIEGLSGEELSLRAAEAYDSAYAAALDAVDEAGVEVTVLEGDELDKWRAAGETVIEDYIQDRSADGLPAQEIVDFVRDAAQN